MRITAQRRYREIRAEIAAHVGIGRCLTLTITRTNPIARVKRAAERKQTAEWEFRAAIREAHGAGASYAAIAAAAGTSRQQVRYWLTRPRSNESVSTL
jgi:hypothetical protein